MNIWIITFAVSTALAAAGFVVVAILWLKKVRESLMGTMAETISQQVRSAGHVAATLTELQRHQHLYEQRLQTLTEANIRMRQDLNALAHEIALADDNKRPPVPQKVLH